VELLFKNFGDDWPLIGSALLLFFAVFSISFLFMQHARAKKELRRRAQGIKIESEVNRRALAGKSHLSMDRLITGISKHFDSIDPVRAKVLRSQLIQAGLYDPRWVPGFFAMRAAGAVGFGVLSYVFLPYVLDFSSENMHIIISAASTLIGYMAPVFWLSKRIAKKSQEHRSGFPDFMDLLVVCADAGVSMEASMNRVGAELSESYPSLSANLHLATLEIRAGKTISDALEHLGERLAIDEARAFATLLQQSEELGSSLTEALPAKLVLPLGLFIFPILFVVILLPAVMKVTHLN